MTFCDRCGYRLDEDAVLCGGCGSEVEVARRPEPVFADGPRPTPELEVTGPRCTLHPGMPLAGTCPRCRREVCIRCAPEAARDDFTCTDCVGLGAAHRSAPSDAVCAQHPEARASFICARCGSFACAACANHSPGQQGLCVRCGSSTGALASRGTRFVANLVDNFVFVVPAFAVVFVGGMVGEGTKSGAAELIIIGGLFGGIAIAAVAQIIAQVQWGQSLGKRMLGIKVVRTSGEDVELWRLILLRNVVVQVLAQLCGIVGLVDALLIFGDDRRCLHDHLADTMVVEVQPPT